MVCSTDAAVAFWVDDIQQWEMGGVDSSGDAIYLPTQPMYYPVTRYIVESVSSCLLCSKFCCNHCQCHNL